MKAYVTKLLDICSLWNIKFYDYQSYEEKWYYSLRCF